MAEASMIGVFNSKISAFNEAAKAGDTDSLTEIGIELLRIALEECAKVNVSSGIKDLYRKQAMAIASHLAKLAKTFSSTISIEKDGKSVNVTKLMMLMGMGIKCGDTVNFTVEGEDEEAASKAIEEFKAANL